MKQILFLCSGNYYRSRFAEHFFNWLAAKANLPWRADSRGLNPSAVNIGPIASHTLDGLKLRDVPSNGNHRYPSRLTLSDLIGSDLVIAVKEAEHRPILTRQFPLWANKVEYWHVDDLDCADSEAAIALLDKEVRALVQRLDVAEGEQPQESCTTARLQDEAMNDGV